MSKLDLYSSLTLEGSKIDREIASAYLEGYYLGVNEKNDLTTIYFKNIDKNKIEHIIKSNFKVNNWFWKDIENQDWMHNWKPYFKDILIENKVVVVPAWSNLVDDDKIVLKIDPGMAFGTGHHETTELMIGFILKYHEKNMSVLDIGTGSGILSILAYKLKSKKILSVDNDPLVKENFIKNKGINDSHAILEIKSCFNIKDFRYDLILANINKNILIDLIPLMTSRKKIIVLSGILESDYDEILDVISKNNFRLIEYNKINEWVGVVIK